ncbi:hypothetical protein BS47DRAFT_1335929, partial [Hydnum rufescens UP504]
DPEKPVVIPKAPKEKTLRPAREMMKNVQGSSAGAGSGEFHVYKQNRRREYERLKLMDEKSKKEAEALEFEQRRRERLEAAEAKTAKNRAKRQKKKQNRSGKKDAGSDGEDAGTHRPNDGGPMKEEKIVRRRWESCSFFGVLERRVAMMKMRTIFGNLLAVKTWAKKVDHGYVLIFILQLMTAPGGPQAQSIISPAHVSQGPTGDEDKAT